MLDMAVAYPLNKGAACVVTGITKPQHVASNAAAASVVLPQSILTRIDAATEPLKQAMGSNADLWQGAGNGRIR